MTTFVSEAFEDGPAIEAALLKAQTAVQPQDLVNFVTDDDPQLSDSRTPTDHAASHAPSGSDPITPESIGAAATGHNHDGTYAAPSALTPIQSDLDVLKTFSYKPQGYRIGFAGDSIAQGIGKTDFQSSFIAWQQASENPLDIVWDSLLYSEGGYNFAIGGANTATILATQAPQIALRPPEVLFVNGGTNNGISTIALADAAFADINNLVNAAFAAGVKLIFIYPIIPKSANSGNATTVNSVSYFNARLLKLCQSDRRLTYLNPDPFLADGSSKFHLPRGVNGTIGGVSSDGTHLSGFGSYSQRNLFKDALPKSTRRTFAGNPGNIWNATSNPLGNVLGGSGYFIESGGLLNTVADPGLGKEWVATISNGFSVAPTLVDSDVFPGFKCQRLEISGTATSTNVGIKIEREYYNASIFLTETSWNYELYVRCKNFVNLPPPSVTMQTTGGAVLPIFYRQGGGSGLGMLPGDYLVPSDYTFYFRNPGPIITNVDNRKFDLEILLGSVSGAVVSGTMEIGMVSIHPAAFRA